MKRVDEGKQYDKEKNSDSKDTSYKDNMTGESFTAEQVPVPEPDKNDQGDNLDDASISGIFMDVPSMSGLAREKLVRKVGVGHLRMYEYEEYGTNRKPLLRPVKFQIGEFSDAIQWVNEYIKLVSYINSETSCIIDEPEDQPSPYELSDRLPNLNDIGENPFSWTVRMKGELVRYRRELATWQNPEPHKSQSLRNFLTFLAPEFKRIQQESHAHHFRSLRHYTSVDAILKIMNILAADGEKSIMPKEFMSMITRKYTRLFLPEAKPIYWQTLYKEIPSLRTLAAELTVNMVKDHLRVPSTSSIETFGRLNRLIGANLVTSNQPNEFARKLLVISRARSLIEFLAVASLSKDVKGRVYPPDDIDPTTLIEYMLLPGLIPAYALDSQSVLCIKCYILLGLRKYLGARVFGDAPPIDITLIKKRVVSKGNLNEMLPSSNRGISMAIKNYINSWCTGPDIFKENNRTKPSADWIGLRSTTGVMIVLNTKLNDISQEYSPHYMSFEKVKYKAPPRPKDDEDEEGVDITEYDMEVPLSPDWFKNFQKMISLCSGTRKTDKTGEAMFKVLDLFTRSWSQFGDIHYYITERVQKRLGMLPFCEPTRDYNDSEGLTIDVSSISPAAALLLIEPENITVQGINTWEMVQYSNYFTRWWEEFYSSWMFVQMMYKGQIDKSPVIQGLRNDRHTKKSDRMEMVKSMMAGMPAPWSGVFFDRYGSRPGVSFFDIKTMVAIPYSLSKMIDIAKVVWKYAPIFGFAGYFMTGAKDVVEKVVDGDGNYKKSGPLYHYFDRLVLAKRQTANEKVMSVDTLVKSIVDNEFFSKFSLDAEPITVFHPVKIRMVEKLGPIPDQHIINVSGGVPVKMSTLEIYYAFDTDLVELGTNFAYPDVKLRYGVDDVPVLLYNTPVDILLSLVAKSPVNRMQLAFDDSKKDNISIHEMVPVVDTFIGLYPGVSVIESLPTINLYSS
jgi:hypothetical protein